MANQTDIGKGLIQHLLELRTRLLRVVIAIVVVFVCLAPFSATIFDLVASPMMNALPQGTKMIATGVIAPFMVPIKITLLLAFLITLPYVLYQTWAFIAPGLYAHEKKLVTPLVATSSILFALGFAFCYFFVFGTVFRFIHSVAPQSITVAPDIESYYSFVITMFIAFGLAFEVPVVVVVLARAGIVNMTRLKQIRPYVIVGAFVIAAIVTPPDVMSQLMLAIPLCLLYEIGLLATPFFIKSTQAPDQPKEN